MGEVRFRVTQGFHETVDSLAQQFRVINYDFAHEYENKLNLFHDILHKYKRFKYLESMM